MLSAYAEGSGETRRTSWLQHSNLRSAFSIQHSALPAQKQKAARLE
jgi:hypothetical protein